MRTTEEIDREVFGIGKEPGEQGSVEWLMERVGCVTASRFKDVMDKLKSGKAGAKRNAYLWEVVIERLTGKPAQHFESTAMMHGTEHEPQARMAHEAASGLMVLETGFIHHPTLARVGGSPDGLIGDDGGAEYKCPFNSAVHLQTWLEGMPDEHLPQIQGLMWITGRQWWDFGSFDPRLPPHLNLYIERIKRDEPYIRLLQIEVEVFLAEVEALCEKLNPAAQAAQAPVMPLSEGHAPVAAGPVIDTKPILRAFGTLGYDLPQVEELAGLPLAAWTAETVNELRDIYKARNVKS